MECLRKILGNDTLSGRWTITVPDSEQRVFFHGSKYFVFVMQSRSNNRNNLGTKWEKPINQIINTNVTSYELDANELIDFFLVQIIYDVTL